MKMQILGTRGSLPVAKKEYLEYGGNTSCLFLEFEDIVLIIDAGTGMMDLHQTLAESDKDIHILISHVHFDHIQGLLNFKPLFQKGRNIFIYGEVRDGLTIAEQLGRIICPPFWPVGIKDYNANVKYIDMNAGCEYEICSGTKVYTHRSVHPDMCMNYRIDDGETSIVYALDYEYIPENMDDISGFCRDADAIVFDAAYLPGEEIPTYGHSTWKSALEVAKSSCAKKVIMSHYSHHYNDTVLAREENRMNEAANGLGIFAKEGMIISFP